jgi:hypothetical protein
LEIFPQPGDADFVVEIQPRLGDSDSVMEIPLQPGDPDSALEIATPGWRSFLNLEMPTLS